MTLARRLQVEQTNKKKWKILAMVCFLLFLVCAVTYICGLNATCSCCSLTRKKRAAKEDFSFVPNSTRPDETFDLCWALSLGLGENLNKHTNIYQRYFSKIFWTSFRRWLLCDGDPPDSLWRFVVLSHFFPLFFLFSSSAIDSDTNSSSM